MALIKQTPVATPDFEGEETFEQEAAVQEAAVQVAAPVEAPKASVTLAPVKTHALAERTAKGNPDFVMSLKNKLRVDWNTLAPIGVEQGQFLLKETEIGLGRTIRLKLMSYQDSLQITPNNDKDEAAGKLVRYSDDGKTVLNENNITPEAWLQKLRDAGYADAKMNKRCVIVGALVGSEIPSDEVGSLVQINLSPQSKIQFDRYIFRTAYDLTEGAKTEEETLMIDLKAVISKNGKNTYTSVQFAYAKA